MQFIKCIASKPSIFENISLDFTDKVNIIFGKNGTGKTFLAKSLIEGIWGKFSGKKLMRNDTWETFYLELLFALSPVNHYKFRQNKNKYFTIHYLNNLDEKIIYSENSPESAAGPVEMDKLKDNKVLHSFINQVDFDIFMNTSFVPSPADIEMNNLIDYSIIKRIILSDASHYYDIHNRLQRSFNKVNISDNKLVSGILRYESMMKEMNKKITIIDIQNTRIEKINKEKDTLQGEVKDLQDAFDSLVIQRKILNNVLADLQKIEDLNRYLENIKQEVQYEQEKLTSITNLHNEIDKLFPQFKDLDINNPANLEELQGLFIEIRNLNEKIDHYYIHKKGINKRLQKSSLTINVAAISLVLSIFIKNQFSLTKDLYLLGGILAFALILSLFLTLIYYITLRKKDLIVLNEEKESLENRLKLVLEKSRIQLQNYKLSEIYEFLLQYFENYIEYTERIKDLAGLKDSVQDSTRLKNIEAKLKSFKNEEELIKDGIKTSIESLKVFENIELDSQKIEQLIGTVDAEIAKMEELIDSKKNILDQIDREIEQNTNRRADLDIYYKEKDKIEKILKRLSLNHKVINFIMNALSEANTNREAKQLEYLAISAFNIFNYLTGNQFLIKIDEQLIARIITENAMPAGFNPTIIHALLLSIKISLTDFLIAGDMPLPLVIDDPFQYMDSERIERFKKLIMDVAEKRQVLIFTHHGGLNDWGHYFELQPKNG